MFQGSMVAVATPMQKGNAPETPLDKDSLAGLVEFHIENKTDAIVAVGTTGESATLNNEEHCEVIRQVVEFVNGRVPVIAGTGKFNNGSNFSDTMRERCGRRCMFVGHTLLQQAHTGRFVPTLQGSGRSGKYSTDSI